MLICVYMYIRIFLLLIKYEAPLHIMTASAKAILNILCHMLNCVINRAETFKFQNEDEALGRVQQKEEI